MWEPDTSSQCAREKQGFPQEHAERSNGSPEAAAGLCLVCSRSVYRSSLSQRSLVFGTRFPGYLKLSRSDIGSEILRLLRAKQTKRIHPHVRLSDDEPFVWPCWILIIQCDILTFLCGSGFHYCTAVHPENGVFGVLITLRGPLRRWGEVWSWSHYSSWPTCCRHSKLLSSCIFFWVGFLSSIWWFRALIVWRRLNCRTAFKGRAKMSYNWFAINTVGTGCGTRMFVSVRQRMDRCPKF